MDQTKIYSVGRLSFFRSHYVEEHKRLVVYTFYEGDVLGYFIGWEGEEVVDGGLRWFYIPITFIPKTSDSSAQEAIDLAVVYISTKTGSNPNT
jgi:hypothetical protein